METIIIDSSKNSTELEVHFNLWDSDKNKLHCLDIGLMCPVESEPYTVNIKIPGKGYEVVDLAGILIKENIIANNVFNCDMKITPQDNGFAATAIKDEDENQNAFLIQQFIPHGSEKEQNIFDENNYTKISFNIENDTDEKYKYFRIRIKNFYISPFSCYSILKSKIFESSYEKNIVMDFRINDIKLLPLDIGKKLKTEGCSFSKIHFLYLADIDVHIQDTNMPAKKRLFEIKNWGKYTEHLNRDMIAYHFSLKKDEPKKEKQKSEDIRTASFLLKSIKTKTSILHLFIYALVIIILAIIANFISSKLGF